MKRKFWTPRVKAIVVAAVVLALLVTIASAVITGTPFLANAVQTVLSPLRSAVAAIDRQAERYYNYLFAYESLQAENEQLKKELLDIQESVRTAETYQRENEHLRQLLGLSEEHEDYKYVSAYIISWNSSNYKLEFTIAKGETAGLAAGMCAVTGNGQVVGLITEVGANWATVTTILDSSLEISASIASSGYTGVVQGTYLADGTSVLRMNYLPTAAVHKNNDQVVTTGSTLYPRGLLLGYLTDVDLDETGVAKYATLEPSCEIGQLEQIFIITEYQNG